MSVYIKDMKMPSCCADGCDFLEPMGIKCLRTHKFLDREDYRYERPEDCPLVEVPEPHGRLIDADKYITDLTEEANRFRAFLKPETIVRIERTVEDLTNYPAVIEAEGKEDK